MSKRISWFFMYKGPAKVMKAWKEAMPEAFRSDVGTAAMTLIEGPLQTELTLLAKDTSLHSTSASLTQKKVTEYDLDRLIFKYRAKAPNLFNLLHDLASNNTESTRDPNVVVPHIIGMLLIMTSKSSNYLPRIFGIFLYSMGASRQVMDVLSKTGFTVSYNSVMNSLTSLTNDALLTIQKLILKRDVWFFIVFDNINTSLRKLDQWPSNLFFFLNFANSWAYGTIMSAN